MNENMMVLYTRNQCASCTSIKRHLTEQQIPFTEVNIQRDYDAGMKLIQDGIRSVPVLELEDGTRYVGGAAIFDYL